MPEPITWSIPGLIYLGTLAGEFTFAEISAANLVPGVLILVLGILGGGGKIIRWLPLPIVMGMFAGSIFSYVTRLIDVTVGNFAVAGPAVGGYLLGRLIGNPRVPPVGLAVLVDGQATSEAMSWLPFRFPACPSQCLQSLPSVCPWLFSLYGSETSSNWISDRPGLPRTGDSNLHRHRNHIGDKRISGRAPVDCGSDRGSHLGRPRCQTQGIGPTVRLQPSR